MNAKVSILLASVLARLLALWLMPEPHLPYNAIFAYIKGAQILLDGEGFLDASFPVYTPPLYAMCIGLMTFLFGDGIGAIKLLQIVADSVTALTIYVIIKEIFDGLTGYLSAIIWAVYPFAIYSTLYVGTEALFTFFIALWLWLTVRAIKSHKWQYYCGAGAILGFATLTRGTSQFMPMILPFILFVCRNQSFDWLRGYLLSLACFIVVIFPWGVRNYIVLHEIIPIGANSMPVLMGSSESLLTIGAEREREILRLYKMAEARGIVPPPLDRGPVEKERFLMKLAIMNYSEQLETDSINLAIFMMKKLFRLLYSTESGSNHRITLGVNVLIYIPAVFGIAIAWRRKKCLTMLLLGLIFYFIFLHWLTLALFRFLIPVMPYLIGFAALGSLAYLEEKCPEMHRRLQMMSR